MDDHTLDESLYYVDHLHLIEAGNAKFASSISNTIRNFNDLKFKLQSRMPMSISHTKSVPVTSSETSLPLSTPPTSHKSPPSIHKPPPSISPRKNLHQFHFINHLHQLHLINHAHQLHLINHLHQLHLKNHLHQLHLLNHAHQLLLINQAHQLHLKNHLHQLHLKNHRH